MEYILSIKCMHIYNDSYNDIHMEFMYKLEFLKLLLRSNIFQVFIRALCELLAHFSIRVFVFLIL